MKKFFLFFIAIASLQYCFAQSIDTKEVPPVVSKGFLKKCKGASTVSWEKVGENFKASYLMEEAKVSSTFDAAGKWIETSTLGDAKILPANAAKYIKTNYKKQPIEKVYHVLKQKNVVEFYAIVVQTISDKKYNVELFFDEAGELTNSKVPAEVEKWQADNAKPTKTKTKDLEVKDDDLKADANSGDKEISAQELPTNASKYIKTNYKDPTIKVKQVIVSTQDSKTVYKVALKKEGKKELINLLFDFKGNIIE
ncbi:MAG: PepSY-like domain-containing protein [Bacteroidota bacterium]